MFSELIAALDPELRSFAEKIAGNSVKNERLLRIVPGRTLSISVTGRLCQQNCAHCNGHYLRGMTDVSRLAAIDFQQYDSVLISGGGSCDGEVRIKDFAPQLLALPEHLSFNIHPGFQSPENLEFLKKRKVAVSFDLPASNRVIKDIFKLDRDLQDFKNLFIEFSRSFNTIPHINLGLDNRLCQNEKELVFFLKEQMPKQLVFILFRPTPATELETRQPPDIISAVSTILMAKQELINTEVKIGCMRPSGGYRRNFDILAWLSGVNQLVQPDHTLMKILNNHNFEIISKAECCAL